MEAEVLLVVGTEGQTQTMLLSASTAAEVGWLMHLNVGGRAVFLLEGAAEHMVPRGKAGFGWEGGISGGVCFPGNRSSRGHSGKKSSGGSGRVEN